MELEEAIQTLKDFAKYGRYYSNNTEHHMKTAINTVLNHLTKQEKMINSILENYDGIICEDVFSIERCKQYTNNCKQCLIDYIYSKAIEESE